MRIKLLQIAAYLCSMNGDLLVYQTLERLGIKFTYLEHPPAPTIEIARTYWDGHDATHCKNIFLRNHKGNRHYLVIADCNKDVAIHRLEKLLRQGKLSFASEKRLEKYLGLQAGSVSPFGLVHDHEKHVHLFLDEDLKKTEYISFHPNLNTASLILRMDDFMKYLLDCGNNFEFIPLTNDR